MRMHTTSLSLLFPVAALASMSTCTQKDGQNNKGTNMEKTARKTGNAGDCCSQCLDTSKCVGYTWRKDSSECWLKSAVDSLTPDAAAVSGSVGSSPSPPSPSSWTQNKGLNCYAGHGATEIDSSSIGAMSVAACQSKCDQIADCTGITVDTGTGDCWRRKDISIGSCTTQFGSQYDTWVEQGKPPKPKPDRLGSFLVIGDWGHDDRSHGNIKTTSCQKSVAQTMDSTMSELGDVKFVVNVGDSFYPQGATSKSDPQWDKKWRNVYSQQARSVPWYSVYGNHDYHTDPGACSDSLSDFTQVNANISNLDYFYMPSYNWYKEHPELKLEVVAMDLNNYMDGWNRKIPASQQKFFDCQYTPCQSQCESRMRKRSEEAFKLFKDRAAASNVKNLLVFSHYPTDYFWDTSSGDASSDFITGLKDSKHHIEYFGGHRHNVDQNTISIAPNTNWLSGGGGGWSCDGSQQGFVVGEIATDGTISTRPVLVDQSLCCNRLHGNSNRSVGVESYV